MIKLLSSLILVAFAFSAQAASHAGGAPMKADGAASGAKSAASAAKKGDMKKADMKHDKNMKHDSAAMKKDEAKK